VKPILLAAALLLSMPAVAQAAEQRLRDADLRPLFTAGALLCEKPDAQTGRCDAIYRWDVAAGAMRETRLETVGGDPIVDMALQSTVRIEADQLCTTLDADQMGYLFIVGGRGLTPDQAAPLREAVRTVYAAADGRVWCTAYYRDTLTGHLRAEVRVDGAPRLELDTTFRVIETSPLPPLRVVRQPWTAPVLRAAAALPTPPAS